MDCMNLLLYNVATNILVTSNNYKLTLFKNISIDVANILYKLNYKCDIGKTCRHLSCVFYLYTLYSKLFGLYID